jgi:hypothetical protein
MSMEGQIPIELKRSERELLLNVLDMDPVVQKKLQHPQAKGNLLSVALSPEELSGVLSGLAAEAGAADDEIMRKAYEELQEKLERVERESRGAAPAG